ncbi:MAG TPA: glutaminase, partial [Polyangia bacterium]|nr:glutaminase [Polyangia bacterium]
MRRDYCGPTRALAWWLLLAGPTACASGQTAAGNSPAPEAAPTTEPVPAPAAMVVMAANDRKRPAGNDPYMAALKAAYQEWQGLADGKNADYIPALAKVDPALFGLALVTAQGAVYELGNSRNEFSIQSISKPLTLARVMDAVGLETVQKRIGVNATGQKFNSILAIELNNDNKRPPPGNPFVNPGAIAAVDMLAASNANQKWDIILGTYSAFAGRALSVNQEVY